MILHLINVSRETFFFFVILQLHTTFEFFIKNNSNNIVKIDKYVYHNIILLCQYVSLFTIYFDLLLIIHKKNKFYLIKVNKKKKKSN